ncbi:MAG: hypothetical protein IKC18_01250 [Bacteroidaceae bacterium]|nr:hypothetical protein [Bacteroidaceae bacterium]
MKQFYNRKSLTCRLILLLVLPLLWAAAIGLTQKPVDTRAKEGIEITMEEPLGGWRYDEDMATDLPAVADSIRCGATGDQVYEARIAYFPRILMRQALYIFLTTLLVILLHDGTTFLLTRRKGK